MDKYEKYIRGKVGKLKDQGFDELARYLKSAKFKNSRYTEIFWISDLPVAWVHEICQLPNFIELLINYFSTSGTANPGFLHKVAQINPKLLIRIIKLKAAFEYPSHWDTFSFFKTGQNPDLKVFYKELDFIRKLKADWEAKERYYTSIVSGLDYEDILVHMVSFFEKFKRSEQTKGNQSLITSHEVSLCYVLNKMLNIKRAAANRTGEVCRNKYTVSEFKKVVQDTLPPLNTVEGIIQGKYLPVESVRRKKKLTRETIRFYLSLFSTGYQIDKYLSGHADFVEIENLSATLRTNRTFAIHWRNDKKIWYQENLTRNKAIQRPETKEYFSKPTELYEKQNFLAIQAAIEYGNYLKLPDQITEYADIGFNQLFTLLKTFSNYLMPDGRKIFYTHDAPNIPKAVFRRIKPTMFSQLFECNYLVAFEEDQLLKSCTKYFGWDASKVKVLIDFLTTDLEANNNSTFNILKRPLIKIGSQYIWLSSLLRDRKWEVLFHKRWLVDVLGSHQKQSAEIEKGIAEQFKGAGFKAVNSYKFKDGESEGEIDTIAFKDNTLFIIELKTTYLEEDLLRYGWYSASRFETKARNQLERAQDYIEKNFILIKSIPELGVDCELADLKVIPLIVSNIFEIDDLQIHNEFRKISLFELSVILKNDLYNVLNSRIEELIPDTNSDISFSGLIQSFNRLAPHFKNQNLQLYNAEQCNLWAKKDNCSPHDLIEAIDQRKVWKGLDEMMGFEFGESISIGCFDII